MITTLRTALWGLLLPWLFATCQSGPGTRTVKLTIQSTPQVPILAQLDTLDVISMDHLVVAQITLDSTESTLLEFEVPRAMFARLQLGDAFQTLYLVPGDELTLQYDTTRHQLRFQGTSADANNYLAGVDSLWQRLEPPQWRYLRSITDYQPAIDSLEKTIRTFHRTYVNSTHLPAPVAALFQRKNELDLLKEKLLYYWSTYAFREAEVPAWIEKSWDQVPFEPALLRLGIPAYASILDNYLQLKIFAFLNSKDPDFVNTAYKKIQEVNPRAEFQEFFRAKLSYQVLSEQGITPALRTFFTQFERDYPTSGYLAPLQARYLRWEKLQPGQPAPDIQGITPEGKAFSLHELRGKVVYVDVWATWCGPCLSEFRFVKPLKKHFEGNDQVAFLYVSIDEDASRWQAFLRKNPDLTGIHIHQTPTLSVAPIAKDYPIEGIPHFMLIDQAGNIISASAAPPSSGEVEKEIRKVLARDQPLAAL